MAKRPGLRIASYPGFLDAFDIFALWLAQQVWTNDDFDQSHVVDYLEAQTWTDKVKLACAIKSGKLVEVLQLLKKTGLKLDVVIQQLKEVSDETPETLNKIIENDD